MRAECLKVVASAALAGQGHDAITTRGEQIDRNAAHTARRARDQNFTSLRSLPVVLHAIDGECCGKSGGAERHAIARTQ